MNPRLLNEASFSELMIAAAKKLGRDECLVLAYLKDDPTQLVARVYVGDDDFDVQRESIMAHGR